MVAQFIGSIVRLQVQQSSLKVGNLGRRQYVTEPIVRVPRLVLASGGTTGVLADGERVVDVHNQDHAGSKYRGENPVSVVFTAHYKAMRTRFGNRLVDGSAGENILVEGRNVMPLESLGQALTIRTSGGEEARLEEMQVAEPCVEFTRYALQLPPDAPSDPQVLEALSFLRAGMRGFYARYSGQPMELHVGDLVYAFIE